MSGAVFYVRYIRNADLACVARWKRVGKCGFYVRGTEIFTLCKRMRPKHIKIWWSMDVENFCVGKRICGVKNLGRPQVKIFTSGIQFNVLQYDASLRIESETLSIQFNVMQHDRLTF